MPRVLLTRPQNRTNEADEIHKILSGAGVTIQELPMLNFELPRDTTELDSVLLQASEGYYEYVILASPTAVNFLEERARDLGLIEKLRTNTKFGAVGQATGDEIASLGMSVGLPIPVNGGSHQLGALLAKQDVVGKRLLLLQSQIGLEVLAHALSEIGAIPERVTLYYTKGPTLGDSARLLTLMEGSTRPDVIAFFSPSSVSHFIHSLAEMASSMLHNLPALACIGETTAKAVEEALHRRPEIVARKADQMSLAQDILTYFGIQHRRD